MTNLVQLDFNMQSDSELISLVVSQNDQAAFSGLVTRYQSAIRHFLRRLTAGDRDLADDIAQETFILAFEKLYSFKGKGSFSAWLHKLAYHKFCRTIQTGAQHYETATDHQDAVWQSLQTHDAVDADILAESLMRTLDLNERLVITLNCSEGYSHSEIVDITGLPLGTVKSLINRSKQKLNEIVSRSHNESVDNNLKVVRK
ncbi:MAG: sigma-70 family RNA polymerase sigma factor [Kangiellaceae bacterium]|jgi:RNA polymerase sigma-70 factor (ECF subfamily)|nr:sigma-70 family RNA polymerase sigma factor [Kangiellaceae bacterium]